MSLIEKYDRDGDGKLSEQEIETAQYATELELREEKAEAQKRMAWISIVSMILFTLALFTPIVSVERVDALSDLLGLFYITQAGIVGAYMGVTAWMSKK